MRGNSETVRPDFSLQTGELGTAPQISIRLRNTENTQTHRISQSLWSLFVTSSCVLACCAFFREFKTLLMDDHVSDLLRSPRWLLLSATFPLSVPRPPPWVLFPPHFPLHRPRSSSASSLLARGWALCVARSPFPAVSTEVPVLRVPT